MTRDILQRRAGWLWMAMAVVLFLSALRLRAAISADETVLLYPAMARSVPGGWEVDWQGSIFEAESRGVTTFALRGLLGLGGVEMTDAEEKIFQERSRLFLVDNERWKAIRVQWGRQSWKLGRSGANGRFASRQFFGFQSDRGGANGELAGNSSAVAIGGQWRSDGGRRGASGDGARIVGGVGHR